ncbi:MAG TPA: aspartyl/asparaginyl beta-hydroxylase domain-containing protein [Chitinophagaceae bacterium]|nr:aspartyl/asparaginyl beta-hydroxylase domain-containing protein [Chitinophagaceae bacterium]HRF16577.1 aspartyl/asparaginyl beta-hydroxylase domain-containing protein [Chitinophagaceae bacterium]
MKPGEFIKFRIFRPLLLKIGAWMGKYSPVGDLPVFDNKDFEWTTLLEENWLTIRKELEGILANHQQFPSLQDIQKEQIVLNQDNNWKTYFLFGFGLKAVKNCEACPVTASLLEKIPDMKTAFFSILYPGKHIPAHKGVFKGLIRSHLGLIIPGKKGDCLMRIDNQKILWEEGKAVVFDDTYEHEVWNNSNQVRVVLLIDIIRPFKTPLAAINKGIINIISKSFFVKNAQKNYQEWEDKYYAINDGGK